MPGDRERVGGEREQHPDLEAHVVRREVGVADARGDRRRDEVDRAQHDGAPEQRQPVRAAASTPMPDGAQRHAVAPRDAHHDERRTAIACTHSATAVATAEPADAELQPEHERTRRARR